MYLCCIGQKRSSVARIAKVLTEKVLCLIL